MQRPFLKHQRCDDVRPLCVPKPDTAIDLRETLKCQSCFDDVVDAKIAAHHFQVGPPRTDADCRCIVAVRQYADVTMQHVKTFRMHYDCKWQRLSLSRFRACDYGSIATVMV